MSTTSLSQRVREALAREKPELGDAFERSFTSSASTDEALLVDLNKYFRIELGKAPLSTLDERGCLIDDLAPGMWFKYFEQHVLPTLVRFNLPTE